MTMAQAKLLNIQQSMAAMYFYHSFYSKVKNLNTGICCFLQRLRVYVFVCVCARMCAGGWIGEVLMKRQEYSALN